MQQSKKQIWTITYDVNHDPPFHLVDPDGFLVMVSDRPRTLSTVAFDRGAAEVLHEYDCRLDPMS